MAREIGTRTALTIAGSDPSGGAGLQMDLKCFAALGVHGCSVATAITVQNTMGVRSVFPLSPNLVREQLDAIYDDFTVDVVKTGMLHDASIAGVVATRLTEEGTPLVVDPVLSATAGASLSDRDLVVALRERLLTKAFLVTPNIPEAEELAGQRIRGDDGLRRACIELFQLGCENVLIKGGHLTGRQANDLFYDGTFRIFEGERLERKVHGTGCMLSAFTAAELAKGVEVQDAIGRAKRLVSDAIRFGEGLGKGQPLGNPLVGLQNSAQRYDVIEEVLRWSGALEDTMPVSLIPEVGMDIAFALPFATSPDDVCGIEGRIVRAGKRARRAGFPAFGATGHAAAAVLGAMRSDRRFRCAINLRHSKPLADLCRTLGFKLGTLDHGREPRDSVVDVEQALHATVQALGFVPDAIVDAGGVGREPVLLLLGMNPQQVVEKVGTLVKGLKER